MGTGSWMNYVKELKHEWLGKKIIFRGRAYTVVDVDMNAALLIDAPHTYCDSYTSETTAIEAWRIKDGVYC